MSLMPRSSPIPRTMYSESFASTTFAPMLLLLRSTAPITSFMRDVVGAQLQWIDIDLIFPYKAADARDLGHSGNGVELIADEPVLNGMQGAAVVGAFDRVPEDLAYTRRIGSHDRGGSCR